MESYCTSIRKIWGSREARFRTALLFQASLAAKQQRQFRRSSLALEGVSIRRLVLLTEQTYCAELGRSALDDTPTVPFILHSPGIDLRSLCQKPFAYRIYQRSYGKQNRSYAARCKSAMQQITEQSVQIERT